MGRVWDICGYEPDLPDYDESDRYSYRERVCSPTHGEPCGECSACGGEEADDEAEEADSDDEAEEADSDDSDDEPEVDSDDEGAP